MGIGGSGIGRLPTVLLEDLFVCAVCAVGTGLQKVRGRRSQLAWSAAASHHPHRHQPRGACLGRGSHRYLAIGQ